jgi:hypothetical protein
MAPASVGFLLGSLFNIEDGGYVAMTHWAFTNLHGITIQTTAVFIVTAIWILEAEQTTVGHGARAEKVYPSYIHTYIHTFIHSFIHSYGYQIQQLHSRFSGSLACSWFSVSIALQVHNLTKQGANQ